MSATAEQGLPFTATEDGTCPLTTPQLCELFLNLMPMITGSQLYKYQRKSARRALESFLDNEGATLTLLFSRQSGKSEVISAILAILMLLMPLLSEMFFNDPRFNLRDPNSGVLIGYRGGVKCGVYAPKKDQSNIVYKRVRGFFNRPETKQLMAGLGIGFEVANGNECILNNGSYCRANTASKEASIEGDTYHIIITDETQEIDDQKITKSILPMGASTNATVIHIGTASIGKCYFYRQIKGNERRFAMGGRRCHYQVDWEEAAEENTFYKKYVTKMRTEIGEQSDEFQMAFKNKWLLERGMFITQPALMDICDAARRFGDYFSTTRFFDNMDTPSLVAGIDFAKQSDRSVLTIGKLDFSMPLYEEEIHNTEEWRIITYYGIDIIEWFRWEGDDYEVQFMEMCSIIDTRPFPVRRLGLDVNGCGAPIADRFKARYSLDADIVEVPFSSKTKDQIYRNLSRAVKAKQVSLPYHEDDRESRELQLMVGELLDLEKTYHNGYLLVGHPDEKGATDDHPDSLALCVFAGSAPPESGQAEQSSDISLWR